MKDLVKVICMKFLVKVIDAESRVVVATGWGEWRMRNY